MNDNQNQNEKKDVLDFRALMKKPKAVKLILLGSITLVALLFLSNMFSGISDAERNANELENRGDSIAEEHEKRLEAKLERAISAIEGTGELTIVITLDSLSETVYSERGGGVKTVITPKVRGVAIICEGGGDIVVKQKIVELVSRVLGISSTRISVTN